MHMASLPSWTGKTGKNWAVNGLRPGYRPRNSSQPVVCRMSKAAGRWDSERPAGLRWSVVLPVLSVVLPVLSFVLFAFAGCGGFANLRWYHWRGAGTANFYFIFVAAGPVDPVATVLASSAKPTRQVHTNKLSRLHALDNLRAMANGACGVGWNSHDCHAPDSAGCEMQKMRWDFWQRQPFHHQITRGTPAWAKGGRWSLFAVGQWTTPSVASPAPIAFPS